MRIRLTLMLGAILSAPAAAADLQLKIEIPRMSVAEYHRPYVAIWIEGPGSKFISNLAVWYDLRQKDNEGNKWLKDLRQWWRKSGRELEMPVDGFSGATRAPGEHVVSFNTALPSLAALPPGEYQLVVEAAREVGGRELQKLPFQWPPANPATARAKGEHELGSLSLEIKP
jgi:hypothetical protein